MAKRRPSVTLACAADRYASDGERIVELNANDGTGRGGLLTLRIIKGALVVSLGRLSDGVVVDVDPRRIRRSGSNVESIRAIAQEEASR